MSTKRELCVYFRRPIKHKVPALKPGDHIAVTTTYTYSANYRRYAVVIAVETLPDCPPSYAIEYADNHCRDWKSDSEYYRITRSK